jgi:hypothetical protein
LEFRDLVTFTAYQLERGEISRTLAASDLRKFAYGSALRESKERAARKQQAIVDMRAAAKTPLDAGVARFAEDVFQLMESPNGT